MISYLKSKYYWYQIYQKLKIFLDSQQSERILMYGYPKSGNTWLRLVIYNYRSLCLDSTQTSTISYNTLNALQNNVMDRGTTFKIKDGFPLFYRTHRIYMRPYNLFTKKIFIHRNPLDTLISAYYFYKNRDIPFSDDPIVVRDKLHNIDFYVCYKIDSWINFYNTSILHADFVMNYTEMRRDPFRTYSRLINFLDWDLDDDILKRAIDFSSFSNVRVMENKENQSYGNGPSDGSFKGRFTRSGEECQFNYELKEETINFVLDKFPEFKKNYIDLIE